MYELDKIIRQSRERLDLTQEQFAAKVGVDRSIVSRWENGKSIPEKAFLLPISQVLDTDISSLTSARNSAKDNAKSATASRHSKILGDWEDWQKSFVSENRIISSTVKITWENNSLRYSSIFTINGDQYSIFGKAWHQNSSLYIDAKDGPNGKNYGERAFIIYDLSTITKGYVIGKTIGATSLTGYKPMYSPSVLWRRPIGETRELEINEKESLNYLDKDTRDILLKSGLIF